MMTYRDLLYELKELSDNQLDKNVIVYTPYDYDFEYQLPDGLWFTSKEHPIIHLSRKPNTIILS